MIVEILLFSVLAVTIGAAFCFAGYPFFRVLLPIWAFFTGLMFGITAITGWLGESFLSTSTGVVFGFFVGVILAAIAYFVYSFAIILFGATIGYALGSGLLIMFGMDEGFFTGMVGIIAAVIFAAGFMFMHLPRLLIMVATALGGAMAIITGAMALFGQLPPDTISFSVSKYLVADSFGWLLAWIVLSALGIAVQYGMNKASEDLMEEFTVETVEVTPAV